MDHLPQLRDPSIFRINVPFLENVCSAYDGRGLEDFPARHNFVFAKPTNFQPDLASSAFFQSWLFFGTLTEIFKVYDIKVPPEDFVNRTSNGRAIITTIFLQDYIAAWIVAASREYPGCLDRDKYYSSARELGDKAGSVTSQAVVSLIRAARRDTDPTPTARQVLHSRRQIWAGGREKAKGRAAQIHCVLAIVETILRNFGPFARGIDDSVWDSVLVLCTTLQTAAFFIYRTCQPENPFTVPFHTLPARLCPRFFRQNDWCPREMKIVADLVEGNQCALLLCSQLNRRQSVCHSKCNAGKCWAYQVDPKTYRTQHRYDCHGCDFLGFNGFDSNNPAINELLKAVTCDTSWLSTSRLVPMAEYSEGQLRLVLVPVRLLCGTTFVAISHVWADGMGNLNANALPRCQIACIQDFVNKQFSNKKGQIPFWMDTLCIPVAKDKPPEFKAAKMMAIEHMESIYKSAAKVLVLDRTLLHMPSYDMSHEEIGLRIMCSGWARRLWTLQEGLFQAQVYYQFADSTYTYKQLNDAVRQMHAFPGRRRNIPQNHLLHEHLADPPNCTTQLIDPLARFAHKALSCCWPRISSFFKEMNIRYSQPDPDWFPGMQLVPGMTVLTPRAVRTIAYRTTSYSKDEGLILASLTDWRAGSARPLIKVPSEHRLRACFERFAVVPSQLLFLDQQRYDDTGARWIPQSLLAQSSEGTTPLPFEHSIISDEFSWPSSSGITAEYPSFHITLPPGWALSSENQRFLVNLVGNHYTCFVHNAGSQDAPASLPSNLALILPRSIRSSPRNCVAVLVSILDKIPDNCNIKNMGPLPELFVRSRNKLANYHDKCRMLGRHEALVDLERVPEGQGLNKMLPLVNLVPVARFLTPEGNTRWRVG